MRLQLLALACTSLLLSACGEQYSDKITTTFQDNCLGGGGTVAYCDCFLEKLQDNHNEQEFIALEKLLTKNDKATIQTLQSYGQACQKYMKER